MFRRFRNRNKHSDTHRHSDTRKRKPPKATTAAVSHLFHSVEIVPGDNACEGVQALAGERLLSDEAPPLPLPGCTHVTTCRCKYKHFTDRRTDLRRETDAGLPPRMTNNERRGNAGRRITDG